MAKNKRINALRETARAKPYHTLEEAAEALSISPWKLQRRLAEAGVTFKDLVEGTRRKLALTYLKQPHLPLTEIAFLLGYSELSAFSRAFHRWAGVPPVGE